MQVDQSQPTRQQLAAVERSAPLKVTGKLKRAIDAMVWKGLKRDDAAADAGLTVHGLREALRRPHVKAAYLAECEVLRLSGRARRIHRLEEMVEQDDNKQAVINAVRALDHIDEQQQSAGARVQSPGFVIQIINAPGGSSATVATAVRNAETQAISMDGTPLVREGNNHDD